MFPILNSLLVRATIILENYKTIGYESEAITTDIYTSVQVVVCNRCVVLIQETRAL